jgi:hypothetical protein
MQLRGDQCAQVLAKRKKFREKGEAAHRQRPQ